MADDEWAYTIETEEQLWDEIEQVIATECPGHAHEIIDDALRKWLYFSAKCRDEFSESEDDVAKCSERLLDGTLFRVNPEYVRTQIIYSLLQEDEAGPLYVIASFLLLDGRNEEETYKTMVEEGCFHRLLELIKGRKEDDPTLHRLLLELMYEMSRIERLRAEDLISVDDGFVTYLFQLIEEYSDDVHDPYHYPVIRVLLVLNEQYMVASTSAMTEPDSPTTPLTNRVVKGLSLYGPMYRTFGENLILLLNRETETALQLLILKLLYLLFTTKATYEYFYTNDLRVLLDVIIRNLLDLPNEYLSLRHTYLRVLHPLLAHTQLNQPPHYKRAEVIKVMHILSGAGNMHFAPTDATTARLVERVSNVGWLAEAGGAGEVARKFLGISLGPSDAGSKISVVDVVAVTEKPGVQTPSRKAEFDADVKGDDVVGAMDASTNGMGLSQQQQISPVTSIATMTTTTTRQKKPLPEVPKHKYGVKLPMPECVVGGDGNANGAGPAKKLPPKAPPPRRMNRLKIVETVSEPGPTPAPVS